MLAALIIVFREVLEEDEFRDWPDAGIAIQSYLRETPRDLEELAPWAQRRGTPVWVRLMGALGTPSFNIAVVK